MIRTKTIGIGLGVISVLFLGGYGASKVFDTPTDSAYYSLPAKQTSNTHQSQNIDSHTQVSLPEGLVATGGGSYYVNNNKSTLDATIKSAPWVHFSDTDRLGRPHVAEAWLNQSSRVYKTRTETGNDKKINPVGWHQKKINGTWVYNRGHLLGYALIGGVRHVDASEANPRNIITQTDWSNKKDSKSQAGQNYYEGLVRKALDNRKLVRYEVKPYYQGDELVPRGNYIQAKSSDNTLNFNVFVPNTQPNVTIDYKTGYVE